MPFPSAASSPRSPVSQDVGKPAGASMYNLMRLNHRHEQIINWMIVNPHRNLGECAKHFNYTPGWLSQVVHSDIFQARYRQRAAEVGSVAVHTIANKLNGVAALALEKAEERLRAGIASERFLGETMASTLKMLGYGAPSPLQPLTSNEVHNHVHLHAEDIREARDLAAAAFDGASAKKVSNTGNDTLQLAAPRAGDESPSSE